VSIESFVAALPKVELHVHLVGSASSERWGQFASFDEFGAVYGEATRRIADGEALVAVTEGMVRRLASTNVAYAEVTVTPLAHLASGLAPV
jgi:aminodeoxyfutalosine deaminase